MIFVWNKHVSESKKMKYLKNHGFFESLLYGPGTFVLICANCGDRGHMGEHSGKV
jgi:hypothetical protein